MRDFVQLRDKGLCRYCGGRGSVVDHVVPRSSKGSEVAFDNLVWACRPCNDAKGREVGFTLRKGRLYWKERLVAPGGLFGEALMQEVEAQRTERQLAQGLDFLVNYKKQRGGAS